MTIAVEEFLRGVQSICERKPQYKLGHSGEDGWCDCIGLIIGALKRCGVSWTAATKSGAIHGSNWAARFALKEGVPMAIGDAAKLRAGDVVFKYIAPGQSGYALPGRYRAGKSCDCGVYLDYMHVGVVTGVSPLRITHCTSGGIRVDTTLGKWRAKGSLRVVGEVEAAQPAPVLQRPTVRRGSRSDAVRAAQELLNRHGADLAVDGIFGMLTEQAVRAFQRRCGLTVDGIVGVNTWTMLMLEGSA